MASIDNKIDSMANNLKEKTGKSVEAWAALVQKQKLQKHGEIVAWLKDTHEFTHGYANLVAHAALTPSDDSADLVAVQYAGAKAALMPMYEKVIAMVGTFGNDVEIAPKKANVSLRRSKQFGLVQPSTATRLDIGLVLKGVPPSSRLEASGSFNAMVTHRVRVNSPADIDAELKSWLKKAYEAAK